MRLLLVERVMTVLWFVHVKVKVLVAQSCLTFCDSMDCSPPGSFVHGILQAGIFNNLEVNVLAWRIPGTG